MKNDLLDEKDIDGGLAAKDRDERNTRIAEMGMNIMYAARVIVPFLIFSTLMGYGIYDALGYSTKGMVIGILFFVAIMTFSIQIVRTAWSVGVVDFMTALHRTRYEEPQKDSNSNEY